MIQKQIELVKNQISFHEYAAHKIPVLEKKNKQLELKSKFESLSADLKIISGLCEAFEVQSARELDSKARGLLALASASPQAHSPDITPDDIADLTDDEIEKTWSI